MFTQLSDLAKALVFYGIAFTLVVAVAFVPAGNAVLLLAMCTPTMAVLLMLLVVTRDGYSRAGWAALRLHRPGIAGWGLALVAPLIVLGAAYGVVWSAGIAAFAPSTDLGAGGWAYFALQTLWDIVFATLTFSLAEEIGWRGYLLPRLAATLGAGRGMLLSGLLHGFWHLPIVLLTPFYHPEGNRLLIVPLFLATTTAGGLIFGYLRLRTNSVWPASLGHSAHNTLWTVFTGWTVATSPLATEYLAGESGLLPAIGYGLLAVWLMSRMKAGRRNSSAPPTAAGRSAMPCQPVPLDGPDQLRVPAWRCTIVPKAPSHEPPYGRARGLVDLGPIPAAVDVLLLGAHTRQRQWDG